MIYETRDVIWLRRMVYSKTVEEDGDDFILLVPAPEFKEATAPKDWEGKKNTDKEGQLFTDLTTNKNGRAGFPDGAVEVRLYVGPSCTLELGEQGRQASGDRWLAASHWGSSCALEVYKI
jgi:hypothetical protein